MTIIEKIKKLIDKATSTDSEHESQAFMLKAQELLQVHNLEMSHIESFKSEDGVTENIVKYEDLWERLLIQYIADNNFCSIVFWKDRVALCGKSSNVPVVIYLFNFFRQRLLELSLVSYKSYIDNKKKELSQFGITFDPKNLGVAFKNGYLKDYMIGGVKGIKEKMQEQKREACKDSNIMGLMVINDKQVSEYIETKYKPKNKNTKIVLKGGEGYGNGFRDGKNIKSYSAITSSGVKVQKHLN